MNQVVLVAIKNPLSDLSAEGTASFFIKSASLLDILEQLTTLEILHDYGNLHIFEGETVGNLDNAIML